MKKIIYTFMAFALLAASSCEEKHLDVEQKGVSNTANFYKTDADAESAVTAMYADFATYVAGRGYASDYCPLRAAFNCCSDDIQVGGVGFGDNEQFASLNQFRYDANNEVICNLYEGLYKSIYACNLVIDNFKDGLGGTTPTATSKRCVAEARVIRAYDHMMLAIGWYNPPIVDHLITNDYPTNAESQKAILDFCVKECEAAMADLPERKGQNDKEGAYKVTKGFAQAVAGKAALFTAALSPEYKDYYVKAASLLKSLVESSNYALVPGERYRDLFHVEGDGCEEKIFEVNVDFNAETQGEDIFNVIKKRSMETGLLVPASANMTMNPYYGRMGQIPASYAAGINDEFAHKFLANDGDSYRRKATFLTQDEFWFDEDLVGDLRCDGTVRYCTSQGADESDAAYDYRTKSFDYFKERWNDSKYLEQDGDVYYIHLTNLFDDYHGCYERDKKEGVQYCPVLGITEKGLLAHCDVTPVKQVANKNDIVSGTDVSLTNCTIMRLGEAYLLYAEACIKNGNSGEALKYINMIQKRAGSKNISTGVDLQVLQNEMQYELWMEGCRWADLVRWGIAKDAHDKTLDNVAVRYDNVYTGRDEWGAKRFYTEIEHPLAARGINAEFLSNHHEYFPIPQEAINRSQGHLTQNPYWGGPQPD